MERLTATDIRILRHLAGVGGTIRSANRLANDLEICFPNALKCLDRLERLGALRICRSGKGSPFQIVLAPGCPVIPARKCRV